MTYGKERMFTVYFMKEKASFDPCFHQNKVQVDSLGSYLQELEADEKWQLDSIRVSAYASPDGPTRMNDSIANLRGWNLS